MAGEEERRNPNLPEDDSPREDGPVEEAQGSPDDPDIVEETGDVVEESEAPSAEGQEAENPEADGEEPVVPLSEFEAVSAERDQYLDALKRLKAEFDNSRKRQQRERARTLEAASEKLVQELLPVLDNLDRALESDGDIRGGVQATREQLANVLAEEGLVGLVALLTLLGSGLALATRLSRVRDPMAQALSIGLGAGLVVMAAHSLLEITLFGEVGLPLFALLGVGAVVATLERDPAPSEVRPAQA